VFDAVAAGGVVFHAATGIDADAIAAVQSCVRRRLLRALGRRGLLPGNDAQAMGQWRHGGGISLDGSVRIEAADRAGRERPLRNSRPATVRFGSVARTRSQAPRLRPPESRPRRQYPALPDPARAA